MEEIMNQPDKSSAIFGNETVDWLIVIEEPRPSCPRDLNWKGGRSNPIVECIVAFPERQPPRVIRWNSHPDDKTRLGWHRIGPLAYLTLNLTMKIRDVSSWHMAAMGQCPELRSYGQKWGL
jgi:hypothetical protein